ncbi:MAG: DUF2242 domain-containing protein [Rhodocyclaceae bacterium]|nr:DUF2242 domain-containing protein [Rhodocyclaceae bacterium]
MNGVRKSGVLAAPAAGRLPARHFAAVALLLAACGGDGPVHHGESFAPDSRYRRIFNEADAELCGAARRVLLGQGYVVRSLDVGALSLEGSKQFPGEEQAHSVLRVFVNCVAQKQGTSLFVTAEEERFDIKRSSSSTAVGLPMVAPITVSRSATAEQQVKTRGETVGDRSFFDRFFTAVRAELQQR